MSRDRNGCAAGAALGQALNHFVYKTCWRQRRMDAIIDAFARSTRHKSYEEMRDELFEERGLGKIED